MDYPLPERMVDHWSDRTDTVSGDGVVYWHMLLGGHGEVRDLAALARTRLAEFDGLHFTPDKWLHITILVAGPLAGFSDVRLTEMAKTARHLLSGIGPVSIDLGTILYHPRAIMLGVRPAHALEPVRAAVQRATGPVAASGEASRWIPHMTIAYSAASQPAAPIIRALGMELPSRRVMIQAVSLVVQWGPERSWDWEPVGTIELGSVKQIGEG